MCSSPEKVQQLSRTSNYLGVVLVHDDNVYDDVTSYHLLPLSASRKTLGSCAPSGGINVHACVLPLIAGF